MVQQPQLRAIEIGKSYGSFCALDSVSIDIQQGEFLTLLGPSGSGKTTFLMILAGFQNPSHGRLEEQGQDITRRPAEQRNFGMVFQGYALFPHMSIEDNVAFPLKIRGVKTEERNRRVRHMLDVVGLGEHRGKRPSELSGGQQQRVAIARALVFEPDMLLLDEPLSALDKNLREQLQAELQRIHRQIGTTFVFVTHDQNEALALSTRIAIFNRGQLAQIDTPHTIYNQPSNRFVAEFLGKMNLFPLSQMSRSGTHACGRYGEAELRAEPSLALDASAPLLAVRPEHMQLHTSVPSAEGHNVVQAVLTAKTYQGSCTELGLSTSADGTPPMSLAVHADHLAARLEHGAHVWLSWPIEKSLLLA
ncbi:ABC transporter ATP-binding protein [Pseudomonas cavernicola]|uniref:Spermidine/putrescine import ATP-binding protein PotA n=1 Tax=Pseudomonas cavernicola TaxID=2320866 RepID=A0A418XNI7_9PSED|nr:ABC transporter ATP-binding protein [Pseudomonas cavernicola]RJG14025.1 ABC transporter ATP-binding protein [Pseudomonas cavernicola]